MLDPACLREKLGEFALRTLYDITIVIEEYGS